MKTAGFLREFLETPIVCAGDARKDILKLERLCVI